mgnify:CR=1 FL=1
MHGKSVVFCMTLMFVAMLTVSAQAQQKILDVIYLKNGTKYEGKIERYEQGKTLTLLQSDGLEVEIPDGQILKIVQGVEVENSGKKISASSKKPVEGTLKSKGFYNTTLISFAMGSSNENALVLGAGLNTIFGYQFKPFLGVGAGFGIDNYARRGETVYPLFVEWKGILPSGKRKGNYYLSMAGGYGLAFKREKLDITEARGGYMLHPAVGYRALTSEGLDLNLDVGVKFQKATFTKTLFNGDVEMLDVLYRRIVVRVGLTLWK